MPSTISSVKSTGFTQPALLFFKSGLHANFVCLFANHVTKKKKKRLKKQIPPFPLGILVN